MTHGELEEKTKHIELSLNEEKVTELLALLRNSSVLELSQQIAQQLEAQDFFKLTNAKPVGLTYPKFTDLKMIEEHFQIQVVWEVLFEEVQGVQASEVLLANLDPNTQPAILSEKSRSEFIIAPILKELMKNNPNKFSMFSGEIFKVHEEKGLTGECDFLLSYVPHSKIICLPPR